MKKILLFFMLFVTSLCLSGCFSNKNLRDDVSDIFKENPEILVQAINAHPVEIMTAIHDAARTAQKHMEEKRKEEEKKELEERYKNPFQPKIRPDESIRGGGKNAPIVLVEYSDFECVFCSRAVKTVKDLLKKYGDDIQFIYKHTPLAFHKNAKIASQYYEAIRIQSEKKAFMFHDGIYENQMSLNSHSVPSARVS